MGNQNSFLRVKVDSLLVKQCRSPNIAVHGDRRKVGHRVVGVGNRRPDLRPLELVPPACVKFPLRYDAVVLPRR